MHFAERHGKLVMDVQSKLNADRRWLTICTGCLQSAAGLFEAAGKPDKAAALYMEACSWEDARRLANVSGSSSLHLSLAAELEGELQLLLASQLAMCLGMCFPGILAVRPAHAMSSAECPCLLHGPPTPTTLWQLSLKVSCIRPHAL